MINPLNYYKCYSDEDPPYPGYYAVAYCWDIQEGFFMSSDYYDGRIFLNWPVAYFHGPLDTKAEALEYARKYDISKS